MGKELEIRHVIGGSGTFVLRTISGDVRLTGGVGEEAVVTVQTHHGNIPDLTIERSAGRLFIEPRVGLVIMRKPDIDLEFNVVLPRGARVDVKSVSADIVATDLAGDQEYKTVSGDIQLTAMAGRLSVQTISGDVQMRDSGKLELNATTTSGDVIAEAELLDYLRAKTVSGDVMLTGRLARGPRHTVETVSGDLVFRSAGGVTVEPSRALDIGRSGRRATVIGDGAASLSFRSMSGEDSVTGFGGETAGARRESATWGWDTEPAGQPAPMRDVPPLDPPTEVRPVTPPARPAQPQVTRLDVLRALERGEIDVDEAARRLEEVSVDA